MDISFIFIITALILSIVIHEVSHGYMANWLGDPTARLAGRLTLNPVSHIDPVGSILLPAFLVLSGASILLGWAKPVPYNPYNLRNQKWGEVLVAAAGPGINVLIAVVFSLIIRFGGAFVDGAFIEIASYIVYINILLALFNMLPIPPLDGSKVLEGILPLSLQIRYREFGMRMERLGFFAMFAFLFLFIFVFGDVFFSFVGTVFSLLTGLHGI